MQKAAALAAFALVLHACFLQSFRKKTTPLF
jgi:hypothetical protein